MTDSQYDQLIHACVLFVEANNNPSVCLSYGSRVNNFNRQAK